MTITETLKRRFVKDTNLPIRVFEEPYFSHFLELYEEHFQAKTLYEMFLSELSKYEHEQDYLTEYNRVKDAAITYLAENAAMQYFTQTEDMTKYNLVNTGLCGNCVFKETNVGRYFLSIDMVKANFSALRHYNPDIVGGKDTYEDFIGMFTSSEYMKKSKYIRQVIFGNQSPKRQTKYEQYLMDLLLTHIYENTELTAKHVAYFGADELVFDISDFMDDKHFISSIFNVLEWAKEQNIRVRAEYYQMIRIRGTSGYMKKFIAPTVNKDIEFKSANGLEMPFIIRALKGEPVHENDRVFTFEGSLARLISSIVPEFTTTSIA